jgi:hypothetical protein
LHGYGPFYAAEIVELGVAKLTFATQNEADEAGIKRAGGSKVGEMKDRVQFFYH